MTPLLVIAVLLTGLSSMTALVDATKAARRVRSRLPGRAPIPTRAQRSRHPRLAIALRRADIGLAPDEAVRLGAGVAVVAALVALLTAGPTLAAVVAVLTAMSGPAVLIVLAGRRDRRADAGLPVVLDDVARALRGGAAPAASLAAAASGRDETAARDDVQAVVDDVSAGLGLVAALERWVDRRPTRPVRLAVGALAIGASTGGTRSQAVEAVAATFREGRAVEREATALATQARSSALVIVLAPLGFAALSSLSDPRAGAFLIGTPVGLACLTAGVVLDGLGGWWMHRIVRLS